VQKKRRKLSDLSKREERLAYKLLVPSLIILLLIAIYPLGQVFYSSMTNRQFASGQETEFIGFENYRRLLSMRVQKLEPLLDENTGEVLKDPETNEILKERPIDVLPREPFRYKELKQFSILGNRYVIGATDPDFIQSVINTINFTVISVFLELVLGLGIALVVHKNFKGRGLMRTSMLIPWAVITVVSARMWEWMFASSRVGLFNTVFAAIGIGEGRMNFLSSGMSQMAAMIAENNYLVPERRMKTYAHPDRLLLVVTDLEHNKETFSDPVLDRIHDLKHELEDQV